MTASVATTLRRRLDAGEVLVGPSVMTGSPAAVEICAFGGFDWVMLDAEHGPTGIDLDLENLVRAAGAVGVPAGVRVPDRSGAGIGKALDFGAEAIWVPQVATAADAEACVERAKYAPTGTRGICRGSRAGDRGTAATEYRARADRDTLLVALLETAEAVDNAAAIAAVEGIDAICLGPTDFASDIGLATSEFVGPDTPGPRHPTIAAALERVLGAARDHDLVPCAYAYDPIWLEHLLGEGCRFILFGTDVSLFREAIEGVTARVASAKAIVAGPSS